MSTLTKELKVKISADANGLKGALNGINSDIKKVSNEFEGLKKVGEGISSVGKKLTAGLTLPIAGIAVASTKTAGDFESAMNQVSAISGATGKDLQSLEDLAKKMGATTKFSASESADASTSAKNVKNPFSPIVLISRSICVSGEPMYRDVNVDNTNHFCTYRLICALGISGSSNSIRYSV